jgi:hypothetical protein
MSARTPERPLDVIALLEREGCLDVTLAGRGSRSGAGGTRTPDLLGAIQALFQLSYSPGAP